MKITVLARTLDRPESGILIGLHERGHHVLVLAEREGSHMAAVRRSGIRVLPFRIAHRLDVRAMLRLRQLARREQPDVIYALSNGGLSAANLGLVGLPPRIVAYRGTVGNLSPRDPACWLTFLNPRLSKIVCVSRAVERYLLDLGLPQQRVATIYKGHDPNWYAERCPASRRELGIPDGAFVVGCTASIRPGKGVEVLVRACAALLTELPNMHILLVGPLDDPQTERLVREFPEPGRLHLTGFRPDAPHLATLMDLFVLCSTRREGFPKSVIEAMAQGVPAIVSSVAGLPEVVGSGEAGLVVPPHDSAALSSAIRRLALSHDARASLAAAGRRRVAEHFHVRDTVIRMEELFLSVLQGATTYDGTADGGAEFRTAQHPCIGGSAVLSQRYALKQTQGSHPATGGDRSSLEDPRPY